MLSAALGYLRTSDEWVTTLVIGGALTLLSFLVVPAIIINGYSLRVMEAAIRGDDSAPVFEEWLDLLVDGLLVWVIELVYLGIPSLVFGLLFASFVVIAETTTTVGGGMPPQTGPTAGGVVFALVALAAVAVLLVATYILPAALGNFARTGEFTAAFHFRTVLRAAFSVDYAVAVLLAIVVAIVLGTIGGVLTIVLVGVFVLFYLQVVVYHLFGQGFAKGLGVESAP